MAAAGLLQRQTRISSGAQGDLRGRLQRHSILEPGAMAVTQDADEKPKVHMWGILDNGQAIPTDVEWARYRNGQLIDSTPAREVATAPAVLTRFR